MSELYWITRCDAISILAMILTIIGMVVSVGFFIAYLTNLSNQKDYEAHGYGERAKEHQGYKDICTSTLKWTVPVTVVAMLALVFVPTTKEALLIYGVGGTVDYIKSNPTAKQLPDKCIKALDRWVDNLATEKNDSIKKK